MTHAQQQKIPFSTGVLLYSCAQFFVLTAAAMLVYPGGAKFDRHASRYLFLQNFFSDLGATRTYSAKNNLFAAILFCVALSSLGLGLIISSPLWKRIAENVGTPATALHRACGVAARVFAVLAGICFIGVAVTPWNMLLPPHLFFVKSGFTLLVGLLLSVVVLQASAARSTIFVAANCIYLLALLAYLYLLFAGPSTTSPRDFAIQVLAQKIIVYLSVANLAFQSAKLRIASQDSFPLPVSGDVPDHL